ncbi:MAG: hypothetical protein Q4G34_04140 [Micrococcus sp.]|nr:hypothetical protein [Micrococcus sp.]
MSPRDAARAALGTGLAMGVSTLIPVQRIPRWAFCAGAGLLIGGAVRVAAQESVAAGDTSQAAALGLSAGVGGLLGASLWPGLALDGAIERWVRRRGAQHPRAWMAAGAGVAMVGLEYAKRRHGDQSITGTSASA